MIRFEVNQTRLRGGQRMSLKLVTCVLREVARFVKEKEDKRVSIAFVSEKEIRALNKQYRKEDCVTDVLSFGLDEKEILGEIVICYEQAKRQAKEREYTVRNELVFLIVHGMLHLYGYEHGKEKDAVQMFSIQERILKAQKVNPKL